MSFFLEILKLTAWFNDKLLGHSKIYMLVACQLELFKVKVNHKEITSFQVVLFQKEYFVFWLLLSPRKVLNNDRH